LIFIDLYTELQPLDTGHARVAYLKIFFLICFATADEADTPLVKKPRLFGRD